MQSYDTFQEAITSETNDFILNLKTLTRPYLCLAKVIFCPEFV